MADAVFEFQLTESLAPSTGGKGAATQAVTPPPMPKLSPAGNGPWTNPVNSGPATQATTPSVPTAVPGGKTPAQPKEKGSKAEHFIADTLTKGIGGAAGKLVGGLVGSAVPIVGTIVGTAIGSVIGHGLSKAIDAISGLGAAAKSAADAIQPFSAAVTAATAAIQVTNLGRDMERANRMGGTIANYEVASNAVSNDLQKLGDTFLKPGLEILTTIDKALHAVLPVITKISAAVIEAVSLVIKYGTPIGAIYQLIKYWVGSDTADKENKEMQQKMWEQFMGLGNGHPVNWGQFKPPYGSDHRMIDMVEGNRIVVGF